MVYFKGKIIKQESYDRRLYNKQWYSENKEYHKKRIYFKGRYIMLEQNPRTGICSLCGKQAITQMHHIEYHEADVLKDTIELCLSCHRSQHAKKKVKP